jgi:hypothetical protein
MVLLAHNNNKKPEPPQLSPGDGRERLRDCNVAINFIRSI